MACCLVSTKPLFWMKVNSHWQAWWTGIIATDEKSIGQNPRVPAQNWNGNKSSFPYPWGKILHWIIWLHLQENFTVKTAILQIYMKVFMYKSSFSMATNLALQKVSGFTVCELQLSHKDLWPNFISKPWWHHQMETFSALLALCAGNSPVTGEFPSQRPVMRSFDVFFDLRVNKQLSRQSRRRWFETP